MVPVALIEAVVLNVGLVPRTAVIVEVVQRGTVSAEMGPVAMAHAETVSVAVVPVGMVQRGTVSAGMARAGMARAGMVQRGMVSAAVAPVEMAPVEMAPVEMVPVEMVHAEMVPPGEEATLIVGPQRWSRC